MNYPFTFTVVVCAGYDPEEKKYRNYRESGMGIAVCGSSKAPFTEAVRQIETYYGEDLTRILTIDILEENNLIFASQDIVNTLNESGYDAPECDIWGNTI